MVLSFKKQFIDKIKSGSKIHTIREDKPNRWHKGREIHFATGIRTPNYNQFHSGICSGVQEIYINPDIRSIVVETEEPPDKNIKPEIIAINDGFNSEDGFWEWFDKPFVGKLIHWTDFSY